MRMRQTIETGFVLILVSLLGACSLKSNVSSTPRASTEQRLLVTSVKRALTDLNKERFKGKNLFLELIGLTADQAYAKAYIAAELKSAGANLVSDIKAADVNLQVFAPAIGVDRDVTLFGIPAFAAPVVGVPVPEVALFKYVQNRGYSEFEAYAFDAKSGRFLSKSSPKAGHSKYDLFTILLFISFSHTDLDKEKIESAASSDDSNNNRNSTRGGLPAGVPDLGGPITSQAASLKLRRP